mgnify:CR=1 FL=1
MPGESGDGVGLFLYIDPLKQGLKLFFINNLIFILTVFIHRSIKTRIETMLPEILCVHSMWFLYIDPLKQGLKLMGEKSHQR